MSRKFITSILIAAVTVTGFSLSAAPAKAGNEDIAKLLFGAATLVIIGKAISDNNNSGHTTTRRDSVPTYHVTPKPTTKPKPHRNRKALPASCLRQHYTNNGRVRMMSNHCLSQKGTHVSRLPESCKIRVRTDRGTQRGYQMRCLRNNGYTLASN